MQILVVDIGIISDVRVLIGAACVGLYERYRYNSGDQEAG